MIFAGTRGYLDKFPVDRVGAFEEEFLRHMHANHADVLAEIRDQKKVSDDLDKKLAGILDEFAKNFA